jgi:hypothetical protein
LDYVLREPGLAGTVDSTPGILKAEIPYVLDNEMVRTIEDLKNRLLQDRIRRSGSSMDANLTEIVRTFRNRGHQGENRDSVFAGRQ